MRGARTSKRVLQESDLEGISKVCKGVLCKTARKPDGTEKLKSQFSRSTRTRDGLQTWCVECNRHYRTKWKGKVQP